MTTKYCIRDITKSILMEIDPKQVDDLEKMPDSIWLDYVDMLYSYYSGHYAAKTCFPTGLSEK